MISAAVPLWIHHDVVPTFARGDAEALLPTIGPYLEDIQRRKHAFDRNPAEPLAAEIRALVRSVNELGAEVKDLDLGMVDFPSVKRGRPIYLCWKLGEGEKISWWHPVETGFAGRRPIKELFEN